MNWLIRAFIIGVVGLSILVGCSPVSFDVDTASICEGVDPASCNPISAGLAEYTTIYSVPRPKVDIIISNDNSGTMLYEQQEMGTRFGTFLNLVTGLDWQLGITTMDISNANRRANGEAEIGGSANAYLQDGKLVRFYDGSYILKESNPNALDLFRDAITIEEKGLHDERGILTASMALQNRNSTGLIRSDSTHVAVIFLTDEDVRSGGEANNTNPALAGLYSIMPRDRKEHFESVWNQVNANKNKTISVHSIIVRPNDTACLTAQNTQRQPNGLIYTDAQYGLMYNDMSNDSKFKGIVGNICSSNYAIELASIGNYVRGRTLGDIPLSKTCDIITDDSQHPITITLSNSNNGTYTFRLGIDPLPPSQWGITNVQLFPGRAQFTPGVAAGTNVRITFTCRI